MVPVSTEKIFSLIFVEGDKVLLIKKRSFYMSPKKELQDRLHTYPPELYFDFPSLILSENGSSVMNVGSNELIGQFLPGFLSHYFKSIGGKASLTVQNKINFIGSFKCPVWGQSMSSESEIVFFSFVNDVGLTIKESNDNVIESMLMRPYDVLNKFGRGLLRLPPITISILKALSADSPVNPRNSRMQTIFELSSLEKSSLEPGAKIPIEISFGIECIPITSNTAAPFTKTNLTVIKDTTTCLLVDPGANKYGQSLLKYILKRLNRQVDVFVTHHHHDHVEALKVVHKLHPSCKVYGHPYTLDKVDTLLNKVPVCDQDAEEELKVGKITLRVIPAPGHTRGHLCLFDTASKTLIAGDHVVGFGSSLLDLEGGGDMISYLETTEKLINLNPSIILPCHGSPILRDPVGLLKKYLHHRLERESSIKSHFDNGATSVSELLKLVYNNIPKESEHFAKQNLILHLEKLKREGNIGVYTL